jgi:4'-phosphopantetheinyl transferase
MNVYWSSQLESDVPPDNNWLSTDELPRLNALHVPKRRADWRLGRWTAKRAAACYLNLPLDHRALATIKIVPASSGAPEVRIDHTPAPVTISLSHRDGTAACVVAQRGVQLGCDLEKIEPRSDTFIADYFTDEEQKLIAHTLPANRAEIVTLLWSAKESTLKALREGLRLDTRTVVVTPEASLACNGWSALRVSCLNGRFFHGWWQCSGDILRTLVAHPSPEPPIPSGVASIPDVIG